MRRANLTVREFRVIPLRESHYVQARRIYRMMVNEYLQYLRDVHKSDTVEPDLLEDRFRFYSKTGYSFSAVKDKKVVGYILAQPVDWIEEPRSVYLDFIVVLPEFRRHGVGSALLNAVKREAGRNAIQDLWTTLNVDNDASKRLLIRNGFEVRDWLFARLSLVNSREGGEARLKPARSRRSRTPSL